MNLPNRKFSLILSPTAFPSSSLTEEQDLVQKISRLPANLEDIICPVEEEEASAMRIPSQKESFYSAYSHKGKHQSTSTLES